MDLNSDLFKALITQIGALIMVFVSMKVMMAEQKVRLENLKEQRTEDKAVLDKIVIAQSEMKIRLEVQSSDLNRLGLAIGTNRSKNNVSNES